MNWIKLSDKLPPAGKWLLFATDKEWFKGEYQEGSDFMPGTIWADGFEPCQFSINDSKITYWCEIEEPKE